MLFLSKIQISNHIYTNINQIKCSLCKFLSLSSIVYKHQIQIRNQAMIIRNLMKIYEN